MVFNEEGEQEGDEGGEEDEGQHIVARRWR